MLNIHGAQLTDLSSCVICWLTYDRIGLMAHYFRKLNMDTYPNMDNLINILVTENSEHKKSIKLHAKMYIKILFGCNKSVIYKDLNIN